MPEISTDDLMRQRFHELRADIDSIEQLSAPLREQRDELARQVHAIEAKVRDADAEVRSIEVGLYEKKNELARLSRALNGQTALSAN